MDLEKQIIERYTSNDKIEEGYYLRIRRKNDSKNIKVYYKGFKVFELNGGEFFINAAIFIPNSKNVFEDKEFINKYLKIPSKVEKDMKKINKYFNFQIGSYSKPGSNDKKKVGQKLNLEFTNALKKCNEEELNIVHNKIIDYFKDCSLIDSIELVNKTSKKANNKYSFLMFLKNDGMTNLIDLYPLIIKLLNGILCDLVDENGCRYLCSVKLNLKTMLKKNINLKDIEEIEKVLIRRLNIYAGFEKNLSDYKNTKSDNNQEKQKQQDFMVLLNKNNKSDTMYIDKERNKKVLYSKSIVPFEMEYTMYSGKEENDDIVIGDIEKRSSKNIKGRIDNVFVERDTNTITLVEIKYGNGVIDGSNGIHKHLIDLYSCLSINKEEILEEFENRVKFRNEVLCKDNNVNISNMKYDIVCIYNKNTNINTDEEDKLSKVAVIKKINSIYKKNCFKAGMQVSKEKQCNCKKDTNEICKDVNKYCKKLLNMNISDLINKLETLCPVRIILVDDEFKKFEEYKPDFRNGG